MGGIEGLSLFSRFPNVDVVFLHSELSDYDCGKVAKQIRSANATIPIVVLSPTGQTRCGSEVTFSQATSLSTFWITLMNAWDSKVELGGTE